MRLSAHLLATAWAAGLATAETRVLDKECWNYNLSLNATNVDVLANCTLYSYQCVGAGYPSLTLVTIPPPPANCTTKMDYNVFFNDYTMTGPLVVPRMVEAKQFSLYGYYDRYRNYSGGIDREIIRPLRVDSIEFPDLASITVSGMTINYANNVSSLKLPKLGYISGGLSLDLSGGPAISLSFPSLRFVDGIKIQGKIDALSFPALNSSEVINITSTGDLDCVAFAATVVNTTMWPTGFKKWPESLECTSNKNSIKTHPVPEDTSSSIGVSWFRGDFLLLAVLVGSNVPSRRVRAFVSFGPQKRRPGATGALSLDLPKLRPLPSRQKERVSNPEIARKGPHKVTQGEIEAIARVPSALLSGYDETVLASPP